MGDAFKELKIIKVHVDVIFHIVRGIHGCEQLAHTMIECYIQHQQKLLDVMKLVFIYLSLKKL